MDLHTKFAIGDRVMILEISAPAKVVEVRFELPTVYYYRVSYWAECKLNYIELQEDELCEMKK
jgi:hypothetical protein